MAILIVYTQGHMDWINNLSRLKDHGFKFSRVNPFKLQVKDIYTIKTQDKTLSLMQNNLIDMGGWNDMLNPMYIKNSTTSRFMDDLIGISGMRRPNIKEVRLYKSFLKSNNYRFNFFRLYYAVFKKKLLLTDLGTIVDFSIINSLLNKSNPISVMEIGGGYGRLAYSLIKNRSILNYFLVDPIPSSIALAADYLDKNEFAFKIITSIDEELERINILHPSDFKIIPDSSVDLVINIESFQEMTQDWVDSYIDIINMKTRSNSFFYHSNSFQYKNRFKLNLGAHWRLLTSFNHPRHWTASHRTEVYVRE
jgi:putative sugar O-methyltransferase